MASRACLGLVALSLGMPVSAAGYDPALFSALHWRSIGPHRGGRVTAVAGVPGQPLVYYFGATGGGVWKTEDAGLSWRPVSDGFFKTGSVGAVAVAVADPNVVYAGMGEACIRSNFSHGDGMYRSTDAGRTWSHLGLDKTRQIGRIRVDPRDPDRVYVAALGSPFGESPDRGVFRSKDGGRSWQKVLFVDARTGAVDVDIDPYNPRVLYAGFWEVYRRPWGIFSGGPGSGLYRSTDGGDSWSRLSEGLPKGIKGRIGVSASAARQGRVYAIVEAEDGGVFRSDDGGTSWRRTSEDARIRERAWYYSHIYADPKEPDTVYTLTLRIFKSSDAGRSFQPIRGTHADNHDLWIAPEDNRRMANGNDGGTAVTLNGGESWTSQDNQATAQIYHVITDNQPRYRIYGAQQDNSTVSIPSRTPGQGIDRTDWYPVGGGESGYVAPSPLDPNVVFAGSYYGLLTRYDVRTQQTRNVSVWSVTNGGRAAADVKYRFQWTFPIVYSPHDPKRLYAAGNVLFQSDDEGQSWTAISPDLTRNDKGKQGPVGGPLTGDNSSADYYCTIFTVAESGRRKGMIWAGSDDGLVQLTQDGGATWTDVTPKALPEWSRISLIEPSPHDADTAYVAVNRYQLGDFQPYLFKTSDAGKSWKPIVAGIAQAAFVRAVREDPARRGLLYAGTETGIYVSFDDGERWQSLQLDLPVVPVTDLTVKDGDLVVATQGRSFYVLDDLTPLHQLSEAVQAAESHLFKPRRAIRVRGVAAPPQPGIGRNPPAGLVVGYVLKGRPDGPVSLEFLDAAGKTLKSFRSDDRPILPEGEGFGFRGGGVAARVTTDPGLNRFVWDMRHPDAARPPAATLLFGASVRGPLAVPGRYQVRLTIGDRVSVQDFEISRDPESSATQHDLERQLALLLAIREKVSAGHRAAARLVAAVEQIEAAAARAKTAGVAEAVGPAAKALTTRLNQLLDQLVQMKMRTGNDVLSHPIRLINEVASIGSVVASADARPTDQAEAAFRELVPRLDEALKGVEDALRGDVQSFNELLKQRGVPGVVP